MRFGPCLVFIAVAMISYSVQAQSPGLSCADFTLAPDQQIAACNALLDNSGAAKVMPADSPRYNLFLNRGAAYARSGDSAMAKADFEQAITLTKEALDRAGRNTGVDYNRSCWAHAVANIDLDLALRHCNEAVRTSRNNPAIRDFERSSIFAWGERRMRSGISM